MWLKAQATETEAAMPDQCLPPTIHTHPPTKALRCAAAYGTPAAQEGRARHSGGRGLSVGGDARARRGGMSVIALDVGPLAEN
mmetsp:Transcript_34254/g.68208  ORF Transcript_34254/g.68208 Transcript_34254/m.68208 type:complete len:83 (+) Transcript_34254:200-448(+)